MIRPPIAFLVLLLALALIEPASAASSGRPITREVSFSKSLAPVRIAGDGVTVRLRPTSTSEGFAKVTATILIGSRKPITITDDYESRRGDERYVGIGRLSRTDPESSVLIQTFTGGAHCCATLKAIVPIGMRHKVLTFPDIDAVPLARFPADLDADGRADFERQDDAFDYAFSSHAASFSPPIIYNIIGGRLVDVSRRPAFRPIWLKFAALTRRYCMSDDDDRNGACAAYVAAGARLGRYRASLAEAERAARRWETWTLDEACRIKPKRGRCRFDQQIRFSTFSAMVDWFLRRHNYLG